MRSLLSRFIRWIKQWKLQRIPTNPQFGVDWDFHEILGTEDEYQQPISGIQLLVPPYVGVVYYYQHVQVLESPLKDSAILKFQYTIHKPEGDRKEFLEQDEVFKQFIGDILRTLIEDNKRVGGEFTSPSDDTEDK